MVIMRLLAPWSERFSVRDSIGQLSSKMLTNWSKSVRVANFSEGIPLDQPKLCKQFLFLGLSPSRDWISWDRS